MKTLQQLQMKKETIVNQRNYWNDEKLKNNIERNKLIKDDKKNRN